MKASDAMRRDVVSIRPDASILEAAQLMVEHEISGLPVVDETGALVGVVTEHDLLRRERTGAKWQRPEWLEFLINPNRLSLEYAQSRSRKVAEVMSVNPVTVTQDEPIARVVRLMHERRIKRVPVMHHGKLVGIIARADLVRAFAQAPTTRAPNNDVARRARMVELEKEYWSRRTKPSS